ncbi:MAG: peptide deformylase [Eubacteriales bacterium]|nr:peptide deformylase [Eubacteriales bacterium]MDD3882210.1 peptide deformylase [Eubacteriales bacterium]MDD4512559.1 peptide deformylase [Eubacteriales bacterium]
MGYRKIITLGNEKLRKIAKPVTVFDKKLGSLLDDMADTMYDADGCGLAAPQVGILKRIVVIDTGDGLFELINPEIVFTEGEQYGREGCLSIPNRAGLVSRPMKVTVRAQDRNGGFFELTGEELLARAICHETDHLDGKLYIDIMDKEIPYNQPDEDGEK